MITFFDTFTRFQIFTAKESMSAVANSIRDEEELVRAVWASHVYEHELPVGRGSGEGRPAVAFGPCPPPGWLTDINDYELLQYDPYYGSPKEKNPMSATGTYYADKAMPICDVRQHRLTTLPPAGRPMYDDRKGRFVMADRDVAAGEVVCMDTSSLTLVLDPHIFRFPPNDLSVWKESQSKQQTQPTKLQLLAQRMLMNALDLFAGRERLVETGRIQTLCSILLELGDDLLMPSKLATKTQEDSELRQGEDVKGSHAWTTQDEQRSNASECLINSLLEDWWASGQSNSRDGPKVFDDDAYFKVAQLLLRCVPPQLLARCRAPKREGSGSVEVCGFFARLGFDIPERMAHFLAVCDGNGLDLQCPQVSKRVGLFPFVRLLEHECRPNCTVMLLDSPITHTFDSVGQFNYDTNTQAQEGESTEKSKRRGLLAQYTKFWKEPTSRRLFQPAVVALIAARAIRAGEPLSISYIPSCYMTQPQRLRELKTRFHFQCTCRWCLTEPDLARGFRCQECPPGMGVVCPTGDGSKYDEWMCLQCGHHPEVPLIQRMLDREAELSSVKADKVTGLARLVGDELIHYTHALVFAKLDAWSEAAWKEQDASACVQYVEALQKCVNRVLEPCDPARSLYSEFLGQVNHALGNAHTARLEYFTAYQARLRAGHRFAHWSRCTRFMAAEKSLADYLDSK